jgi:hypothetical protein
MYWHCGLLDDPELPAEGKNPIRYSNWHTLPEELVRELRIWLAMPGFSLSYHMETLEREPRLIRQFMGGYAELEEDVLMNWISATRDDCIKLGYIRPEKGDLPLITKIEMRRDYMRGRLRQNEIAKEYGVWTATVNKLCWGVPDEIEQLPSRLQQILMQDPYVSSITRVGARRQAEKAEAERQSARRESSLSPEMIEKVDKAVMASAAKAAAASTQAQRASELSPEALLKILDGAEQNLKPDS